MYTVGHILGFQRVSHSIHLPTLFTIINISRSEDITGPTTNPTKKFVTIISKLLFEVEHYVVYCGLHNTVAQSKSHYISAHTIYNQWKVRELQVRPYILIRKTVTTI